MSRRDGRSGGSFRGRRCDDAARLPARPDCGVRPAGGRPGTRGPDGGWQLDPIGTSKRHGGIAALGLLRLPEQVRREVLAGEDCDDLVGRMAKRLDNMTSRGDVALLCWAAAEAGHSELPRALDRLDGAGGSALEG